MGISSVGLLPLRYGGSPMLSSVFRCRRLALNRENIFKHLGIDKGAFGLLSRYMEGWYVCTSIFPLVHSYICMSVSTFIHLLVHSYACCIIINIFLAYTHIHLLESSLGYEITCSHLKPAWVLHGGCLRIRGVVGFLLLA